MANPFPPSTLKPGQGIVELVHIPPSSSSLRTITYQYPLKLVAPAPLESSDNVQIQTIYLLSYGGGLVAGDTVDLSLSLDKKTRLIMLTQGSTKIFKSPSAAIVSRQRLTINIAPGAALCYLPDPVQPFEKSCFAQKQVYNISRSADESQAMASGSLCALDWVSEGRRARGEKWHFTQYNSKSEVWISGDQPRLLLRDNIRLAHGNANVPNGSSAHSNGASGESSFGSRMDNLGVFGTFILCGPLFETLAQFFMEEFKLSPRIGGRKWDAGDTKEAQLDATEVKRAARHKQESVDGLLWSVSFLRNCTVVKFGAREVEGAKRWLKSMLEAEGSVLRYFGERALLCLR